MWPFECFGGSEHLLVARRSVGGTLNPEIFDPETIEYELFMPVVTNVGSDVTSNQTEAAPTLAVEQSDVTPTTENPVENQGNVLFLPYVSNQ